jgi:hypothetical protein
MTGSNRRSPVTSIERVFFCGPTDNPFGEEHIWPKWVSRCCSDDTSRFIATLLSNGTAWRSAMPAPARGDAGFTVLTNWQTTLKVR